MSIRKKSMQELDRMTVEQFKTSRKVPLIVILDNVRSAHNVGSIFRTCDAFRVEEIILCGITPTPPDNEIRKTALGATESVAWRYESKTIDAINTLKKEGYLIISVEQAKNSVFLQDYTIKDSKLALVFGHEVYGVDEEIIQVSDVCLELEQFGTKHSLNVSVCAGIALYSLLKVDLKEF